MANIITEKMHGFISTRIEHIKALKSPNEQQAMFLDLAEKYISQEEEMNTADLRNLKTLATAEQAAEKAALAARVARKLVSEENEKQRKQRTHNLINAAGLLGLAGLLDKPTGKPLAPNEQLLGALIELANRTPSEQEKAHWSEIGSAALSAAKAKKSTSDN